MNLTLSNLLGTLKSTFKVNKLTIDASSLTAARTVTAPDKGGTLAMTSDLGTGTGASAFVNFDGTGSSSANQTIRSSSNVSSVYKDSTGHYTVNFASALTDANYATNVTCMRSSDLLASGGILGNGTYSNSYNASWVKVAVYNYNGNSDIDGVAVNVSVFR